MSTDTRVSFGSMAVLVEAVEENATLNGVLPVEFTGGEALNVILFSRNSTRVVTPLNAQKFRMLSETSTLCENLQTVRDSKSSSDVGRFSVTYIGDKGDEVINVFGFAYEIEAKPGQVVISNMSSTPLNSRSYLQPRFEESTGESYVPVILKASSFNGNANFTVGDVTYVVVGVWDQFGFFTSSGESPTGNGGGVTIIPDAGTLEGDYIGNVLCEGLVRITGPVSIKGSLNTRQGDCIIDATNGSITVEGDWLSESVYTDMGAVLSDNLRVYGDWIFKNVSIVRNESLIYVLGDLIQDMEFNNEEDGFRVNAELGITPGYVVIGGDLILKTFESKGGNVKTDGNVGNGGTLYVFGDINADTIEMNGGDAGSLSDKDAQYLIAGNGGVIVSKGNIKVTYLYVNGTSNNTSVIGNGGQGGFIECDGNIIATYGLYGDGGIGFDDVDENSESGGANGGDGAVIECKGDVNVRFISLQGGPGIGSGIGGKGGEIYANRLTGEQWSLKGGNVTYCMDNAAYGAGGKVECKELTVDSLLVSQGNFSNERNSNVTSIAEVTTGLVEVFGDLIVGTLTGTGAWDLGSVGDSLNGGIGATILVGGKLKAESIDLTGGSSPTRNAGAGGSITVKAGIFVEEDIFLGGGDSGVEVGSSGSINIFGGGNIGSLYLLDGVGIGDPATANAGLTVSGMLTVNQIRLDYRSNVYIYSPNGAFLRVRSMPDKDRLHHIVGENYVESGPINDYTIGSLFISSGPNQAWSVIQGTEIPADP